MTKKKNFYFTADARLDDLEGHYCFAEYNSYGVKITDYDEGKEWGFITYEDWENFGIPSDAKFVNY